MNLELFEVIKIKLALAVQPALLVLKRTGNTVDSLVHLDPYEIRRLAVEASEAEEAEDDGQTNSDTIEAELWFALGYLRSVEDITGVPMKQQLEECAKYAP